MYCVIYCSIFSRIFTNIWVHHVMLCLVRDDIVYVVLLCVFVCFSLSFLVEMDLCVCEREIERERGFVYVLMV